MAFLLPIAYRYILYSAVLLHFGQTVCIVDKLSQGTGVDKTNTAARLLLRSASVEAIRLPPAVARLLPANMAYNMARTVRQEPPMSVGKIGMRIVVTARPIETVGSTGKRMQWYSNKPVGIMEEGKGR